MRVRANRVLVHVRRQWMGALALLIALTTGTAYAANTVGSSDVINESLLGQDIKNGEVKVADIGQAAVATEEIANNQVKATDIGDGEVKSAEIANGQVQTADIGANHVRSSHVLDANLTGADLANNTLKGADIDEATLDVGDAARAYAFVRPDDCTATPGTCEPLQSKGVTSVTRIATGEYCVTAPGIDALVTPAAVTVEWNATPFPEGNASVFTRESLGCGPSGEGFLVYTYHGDSFTVSDTGGTARFVRGQSSFSDDVAFTVVIP